MRREIDTSFQVTLTPREMSFKIKRPSELHAGGETSSTNKTLISPLGSPSNAKQNRKASGKFRFFRRMNSESTSGTTTAAGSFSTTDTGMFFQTGGSDDEAFEFEMVNGKVDTKVQPRVSAITATEVAKPQPRPSALIISPENPATQDPRKSDLTSGDLKEYAVKQSNQSRHNVPTFLKKIDDRYAEDFQWSTEAEIALKGKDERSHEETKDLEEDAPPPPSPPHIYDRIASSDIPPPPPFAEYVLEDD